MMFDPSKEEKIYTDDWRKDSGRLPAVEHWRFIADVIIDEVRLATKMHGRICSAHEGYAIIKEELDELWEIVKRKAGTEAGRAHYKTCMYNECIQIGAMAIRFIYDMLISDEYKKEEV